LDGYWRLTLPPTNIGDTAQQGNEIKQTLTIPYVLQVFSGGAEEEKSMPISNIDSFIGVTW
jgi:hypothetical protein